jgi:DNA-binding NarL/FixJ family response regulator
VAAGVIGGHGQRGAERRTGVTEGETAVAALVGRKGELAALERVLREAARGRSTWVRVLGEPGIGKTALLAELSSRGTELGLLALRGRGAELERDVPLGLLVDALDDHLGSLGAAGLARLAGPDLPVLAAVFPSVAHAGVVVPAAGLQDERYRLFRALRAALERLAARPALLLVLDDMHWADPTSAQFVAFLLRHPLPRVLPVLAWRPAEAGALDRQLDAAGRDVDGLRLELAALAEDDAAELLGPPVDPGTRKALYRDSGGNPFYLLQLARTGGGRAAGGRAGGGIPAGVPPAVVASVRTDIDRLPSACRLLAEGAAVAGDPFDLDLAAVCAGLTDLGLTGAAEAGAGALAAIDGLLQADVVRPTDSPRRFRFRHPIVRRAVYDGIPAGRRLAAHDHAAGYLATLDVPLASRAHHVALSARDGDLAASELLAASAVQVLSSAPESAAGWLAVALRLLPPTAEYDDRRSILLLTAAAARGAQGDLPATCAALEEALGLLPPDSPLRVLTLAACASAEHGLGRFDSAARRLRDALDGLADARPADGAALMLELALSCLFRLDWAGTQEWAQRAAALAMGVDRSAFAAALALQASAHAQRGDLAVAARTRTAAAAALDALTDGELAARPEAGHYLGGAEILLELPIDAERHLARAVTAAGAGLGGRVLLPASRDRALALLHLGRLAEARELAEATVERARLAGIPLLLALALDAHARVLLAAGDAAAAAAAVTEATDVTPDQAPEFKVGLRHQRALLELEGGDPAGCRRRLLAAGAPDFPVVEPGTRALLYEALARAEIAAGDLAAAAGWVDRAHALAASGELAISAAAALRAQARLLLAQGRPDEAAAAAARAAERAAAVGARLAAARSRTLAGEATLAGGRPGDAVPLLAAAVDELGACGARRYRDEAARLLRRLGQRVPRPEGTGQAGGLSAREREIAELVAGGQTNRQIAATLFISDRTVENHLSRIFAKLGVSGRAALAGHIARGGSPARSKAD